MSLPEHLRPDRARYPDVTDAEWHGARAVLDEAALRAPRDHGPWGPLHLVVSRQLPPETPWLMEWRGEFSTDLDDLGMAHRVAVSPAMFKVITDVAQESERYEYPMPPQE